MDAPGNAYVTGSTNSPTSRHAGAFSQRMAGVRRRVRDEAEPDRHGPGLFHLPGRQRPAITSATASPWTPPATPT